MVVAWRHGREVDVEGRRRRCADEADEMFREMGEDDRTEDEEVWLLYRRCWVRVLWAWDFGWTSARLEGVAVARVLRRTPRSGTIIVVGCMVDVGVWGEWRC